MDNFEQVKKELAIATKVTELNQNWIVRGFEGILSNSFPPLDLIDAGISELLIKKQKEKIQHLCDIILSGDTIVDPEMVKDVDVLMEMVNTVNVVTKLSQNEKILYIGNLFRRCFLECEKYFDEYSEWLHRLETLSLREIQLLARLHQFEKGETGSHHDAWYKFKANIAKEYDISENMVVDIFSGMVSSGFCRQSNLIFPTDDDIENPLYTTEYFEAFLKKIL